MGLSSWYRRVTHEVRRVYIEVGKQKHIVGIIIYIVTVLVALRGQRAQCSNHALQNKFGILNELCILSVDLPCYALPPGWSLLPGPLLLRPFFSVLNDSTWTTWVSVYDGAADDWNLNLLRSSI